MDSGDETTLRGDAVRSLRPLADSAVGLVTRRPLLSRWLLAGPGALVLSLLFVMAMPVWLPAGAAGVDHIVWPVVMAPLIWAMAFTYACLEENLPRLAASVLGIGAVCAGLSVFGFVVGV